MKLWTNYHTHSIFCDGNATLEQFVSAAAGKLKVLGFSSHAPLPFEADWAMKHGCWNNYLKQIRSFENETETELLAGLEMDFIPGYRISDEDISGIDYCLGSVHFVRAHQGDLFTVDCDQSDFQNGMKRIYNDDSKMMVREYYELYRRMISEMKPAICAHLDLVKKNNSGKLFSENDKWYKDEIFSVLDVIRENNCCVEINTGGLNRRRVDAFYPSPWIVRECRKKSIEVTICSDAHRLHELTGNFSTAAEMILECGYKTLTVFHKYGKKEERSFFADGIVF